MKCPKCKRLTLFRATRNLRRYRICLSGDCEHAQLVRDEKKYRDPRGITKRKLVR